MKLKNEVSFPIVDCETSLLTACCEAFLKRNEINESMINQIISQNIHWDDFFRLLDKHRVIPILYPVLRDINESIIPEQVLNEIKRKYEKNKLRMLLLTGDLMRLLRFFNENDIQVIPLKGPILAKRLYGDFCGRSSVDLDFLIEIKQVRIVDELLRKNGYKRIYPSHDMGRKQFNLFLEIEQHFTYKQENSTALIEIHWRFFKMKHLFPVDYCLLKNKLIPFSMNGVPANILSFEDNLLYLCAHGASHSWFRLFWLCDMSLILLNNQDYNYTSFFEKSKKLGMERIVKQAFILVKNIFHISIPGKNDNYYQTTRVIRKILNKSVGDMLGKEDDPHLIDGLHRLKLLSLRKDLRYKIKGCLNSLITYHKDSQRLLLPEKLFFLYVLAQPLYWLRRFFLKKQKKKIK